jgi:hypothetical protein
MLLGLSSVKTENQNVGGRPTITVRSDSNRGTSLMRVVWAALALAAVLGFMGATATTATSSLAEGAGSAKSNIVMYE